MKNDIMGFFDKFKSNKSSEQEEESKISWNMLSSLDQLDGIMEESKSKTVAIFKHSTRCGVSRGVLKSFERNYDLSEGQAKLYFLDLLANREISNEIASRFNVPHQSPQMIVIKNGEVVYHDSHYSIEAADLERYV